MLVRLLAKLFVNPTNIPLRRFAFATRRCPPSKWDVCLAKAVGGVVVFRPYRHLPAVLRLRQVRLSPFEGGIARSWSCFLSTAPLHHTITPSHHHTPTHPVTPASFKIAHTFGGVMGISMCRTPRWESASTTALTMAGGAPTVADSPPPLAPSG